MTGEPGTCKGCLGWVYPKQQINKSTYNQQSSRQALDHKDIDKSKT